MDALARLAELLRDDGGQIADAVTADAPPEGALGRVAGAGAHATGDGESYALLVEAIYEGYLQHYGSGRVVQTGDADLALLAGDRLFALGMARLADLGDLAAVSELADVISLVAQAHAEGDPERAGAAWAAGVAAVAHGGGPELELAKTAARAGDRDASRALRAATPVG